MVHKENACNVNFKQRQERHHNLFIYLVLYAIFSQTGQLRWYEVEELLRLCGDHLPRGLENFFQKDEIVTQEKFLQWLERNQGHTTAITDWLMDEQRLRELLTPNNDRVYNQYSILAGVTHCT